MINKILLLGPPGCGKGTQADLLSKNNDYVLISTGNLLRTEMKNNTEFGQTIKKYIDKGLLVPDNIIMDYIIEYIVMHKLLNKQLIFDGFPRTILQAEHLESFLSENNGTLNKVLLFNLDTHSIIERLLTRRICEQCSKIFASDYNNDYCDECGSKLTKRTDDSRETISKRIHIYEKQTKPLINHYKEKGVLFEINADGTINEVYKRILEVLSNE